MTLEPGLIFGAVSAALTCASLYMLHMASKDSIGYLESHRPRKGKGRYFVDDSEDRRKCDICYGELEGDDVAVCKCGKTFHKACAEPTGSCPYCGVHYAEMTVREIHRSRCPSCGRFVKGGVCECGLFLPRHDGTFPCKCGNILDVKKPVCNRCGAIYEKETIRGR